MTANAAPTPEAAYLVAPDPDGTDDHALIILRGTQAAFNWSLFDAGYTFASLIASAASA